MSDWISVVISLSVIGAAAYVTTALLRLRLRRGDLAKESARARRAIRLAEAAQDASTVDVPDAEWRLNRAHALMSKVPSPGTARKAARWAREAEALWDGKNAAIPGSNTATSSVASASAAHRYAAAVGSQTKADRVDAIKIVSVVLLGLIGLIFLANQTQQPDVTFARQDDRPISFAAVETEPPPTYPKIVAQYGDAPIVTLPGATAVVDAEVVTEWMQKADARQIVLAPPLDPDADDRIEVPEDVVLVVGTYASYGSFEARASTFDEMQQAFAFADVTSAVVALLAHAIDVDAPEGVGAVSWREPTAEELAPVLASLEADSVAFVGGAEPFELPEQAAEAYPEGDTPLFVVSPHAPAGEAAVNYADAVAEQLPDRPVIAMTGLWIDYAGSYANDFEAPLTASFYGELGNRLQQRAYSQRTVLAAALNRVEKFRHSGIFDKPLPYQAPDPLKLALPALPWIGGGLGLVAIAASLVQLRRQKFEVPTAAGADALHRLAGLSELAVEVSGLTAGRSQAALLRALNALTEAQDVVDGTSEGADVVDELLERADRQLAAVAELIERPEYEPDTYLRGRWT